VNPYALASDGSKVYVACTGAFFGGDQGKGVTEVEAAAGRVLRFLQAPSGFLPGALAIVGSKLWVGDAATDSLMAVDRGAFTVSREPKSIGCPGGKYPAFLAAALTVGSDVFALCSSTDGAIARLDGATGAPKGEMPVVGGYPIALVQTGDGRIAIANSASVTATLVTLTAAGMTVQKDAITLPGAADLEDIRALDRFVYIVSASSQTVTKVDISSSPPKIVDEVNVNPGNTPNANPAKLELLDADQAVVADSQLGRVIGVQFGQKK
jgi:DNA-binding beta-propeller fold protein YncE